MRMEHETLPQVFPLVHCCLLCLTSIIGRYSCRLPFTTCSAPLTLSDALPFRAVIYPSPPRTLLPRPDKAPAA